MLRRGKIERAEARSRVAPAAGDRRYLEFCPATTRNAEGSDFWTHCSGAAGQKTRGDGWSRLARLAPVWLYELMGLGYNFYGCLRLARAIRANRPDAGYERYALNTFCGILASRAFRIPLILEVNAPLAREQDDLGRLAFRRLARALERWICSHSKHTLVVSGVLKDMLVHDGVPEQQMTVLPNSIDRWTFHPGVPGEAVRQGVVFMGRIERGGIPAHIAAMDIAVQPSALPYACPMKLIEYIRTEKCIVAPDQPNIREILEHGVSGYPFRPADADALQGVLDRLIRDPDRRRSVGQRAAQMVDERAYRYFWSTNAARAIELVSVRDARHSEQKSWQLRAGSASRRNTS